MVKWFDVVGTQDFGKFKEAWFRGVYERHFPELYFYARSFTNDEERIRDTIQDAFLGLLENDRFKNVTNVQGYLYSAVRNSLFNKLKTEKARERIRMEMFRENKGETDDEDRASHAGKESLITLTEKAVESLPERCGIIFTMAKKDGLSYKEIAERLSISVKTVEAQMGIAFQKIREYVAASEEKIYRR